MLASISAAGILPALSQSIREGYVERGPTSTDFPTALATWEKGRKWSEDDNFYISRVKPHVRFRNEATQVNPALTEDIDKKLIFWVPINNEYFNALPDGNFDSEVFPMWSYVTHYGNWSTPLVRIPGNFLDAAHRNGVAVSAVAGIPYGKITDKWNDALIALAETGAEKLSDYLLYYGVDGLGYNSEFYGDATIVRNLNDLHAETLRIMKKKGNHLAENIWYDGTNIEADISFDNGLGTHNQDIWGYGDSIRSALFLNYNWNDPKLLQNSVATANRLGRTPLDLYAGINMQGGEPKYTRPGIWPLLQQYPLSIGLWGAHSENMFYESRAEQGPSPLERQQTYMTRMLNWFTNGSHNPIASHELSNSLNYGASNRSFFGMSKLMSARSALKWSLNDEPFVTSFNLGNGRFFNYQGVRQHDAEWYNIGIQDYLPTWMWWFSTKFLGRESSDLASDGLKAEFTWDDAWMGGSTIRIHGSSREEYLHLFKTEFALREGDEIIFRYKIVNGQGDLGLTMSVKGKEGTPLPDLALAGKDANTSEDMPGCWITRRFIVGSDMALQPGKDEIAMVALHFKNAKDLDMRLGELSIKRFSHLYLTVGTPIVESTTLLSSRADGADGKIIFSMPNDKGDDVCYNTDVNTSYFKLWFQQEGEEPVMMGMTTSWAGLMFSAPFDGNRDAKVRFGVSALALNRISESPIAWGDWHEADSKYEISDAIVRSAEVIPPYKEFSLGYSDPAHEPADWKLVDNKGNVMATVENSTTLSLPDGLDRTGLYNLIIDGYEQEGTERVKKERTLLGYIQISDASKGGAPKISSLNPDDPEHPNSFSYDQEDISEPIEYPDNNVRISYTFDPGEGKLSRGVKIGKEALGFAFDETGLESFKPFSVSFWFKPESFEDNSVHALNIRFKGDPWSVNTWGWMWHTLTPDGRNDSFSIRTKDGSTIEYHFDGLKLHPGVWHHLAYTFDFDSRGRVMPALWVNGVRQDITSWTFNGKTREGEPYYLGPAWEWHKNNIVAVGGYLHKTGSVRGAADNLMVWNKVLTEEDMVSAMGTMFDFNKPEGLIGLFDFESDPDENGLFENLGEGTFKAGMHNYVDKEGEGQADPSWQQPVFCAGSPFLIGDGHSVTSNVEWEVPGADIIMATDGPSGFNGMYKGDIRLYYPRPDGGSIYPEGYPVTLRVKNEFGEDSRTMIVRFPTTSVDEIGDKTPGLIAYPTVFETSTSVSAPADGRITLRLTGADGRVWLSNDYKAHVGETLTIYPDVPAGVYFLTAYIEGNPIGTTRLIRK